MSLNQLQLYDFRNLRTASRLTFTEHVNFFIGENGSGKSSLLEAIYLLGHGKSFRTSKLPQLICHEQQQFVIAAKDDSGNSVGFAKHKQQSQLDLKLNGCRLTKLSELAKHFAVQIITPESFKLFFGGPKERRRFFDLGLFHVEHSFVSVWKAFQKALTQRNSYLRAKRNDGTLTYWSEIFCQYGVQLGQLRQNYFHQLSFYLKPWLEILLPDVAEQISAQYFQGWHHAKSLTQALADASEAEFKFGFTQVGPQKYDVKYQLNKVDIEQALSRGQQKLFLFALVFSQTQLLAEQAQLKPILLIDDFGAELDQLSRQKLTDCLAKLDCQLFISAIEEQVIGSVKKIDNNYKLFHVKQGEIS